MPSALELLVWFVALYPVVTAALWVAGGVLFRLREEDGAGAVPPEGWPGVTVLIPAYNEELVIARTIRAVLSVDYPELEVLVLDDGSTDATSATATTAAGDDRRCRVVRDGANRGKAERLNQGLRTAQHELVVITDADTHMHPQAIKRLIARLLTSPRIAAVAGAAHVTNPSSFLGTMQVIEAATIIGLLRRTQALTGRVGTVAGVLAALRRERVLDVGGFDGRMATEDIDLTWRLTLAGWETAYEPHALVGMQVPATFNALWAQRKRWARGQGEVLRTHLGSMVRWRNHRLWLLAGESVASLVWVTLLALSLVLGLLGLPIDGRDVVGLGVAWGVAISVIATAQVIFALSLDTEYDPHSWPALLIQPIYPLVYWMISAMAALRAELPALVVGPREERVVWDIPREQFDEA
jgi:biofilm PGA synthesis N-glycosyltransferase PgaC